MLASLRLETNPQRSSFRTRKKKESIHASPPNGTYTSLQSWICSRSTDRWVQSTRCKLGLIVQNVTLDFIFQIYVPSVRLQLTELCALLVACNTARGSCLHVPVLVPALWVAPRHPSCASQLFLEHRALIPLNIAFWGLSLPAAITHFPRCEVRLRIGFLDHMIFAYG